MTHSNDTASSATRKVRLVALIMAGTFFILIGAFVAMVFFVHDEARLNADGPIAAAPGAERGGLHFRGTANIWEVRGRMVIDAQGMAHFAFDLISPTGQPAPTSLDFHVELERGDRSQPPARIPLRLTGVGSYMTSAQLSSPGPWRLRIVFPEITGVFEFTAD